MVSCPCDRIDISKYFAVNQSRGNAWSSYWRMFHNVLWKIPKLKLLSRSLPISSISSQSIGTSMSSAPTSVPTPVKLYAHQEYRNSISRIQWLFQHTTTEFNFFLINGPKKSNVDTAGLRHSKYYCRLNPWKNWCYKCFYSTYIGTTNFQFFGSLVIS